MKTQDKKEELREKIMLLQQQQKEDLQLLKEQFHDTYNTFKPLNLLKNTLHEVSSSSEMKKDLLMGALNVTAGYLTHKIADLGSSPVKNTLRKILQFAIKKITGKSRTAADTVQ